MHARRSESSKLPARIFVTSPMTDATAPQRSLRKWVLLALKVAVTGALFWYLATGVDLAQIGERLTGANHLLLLAATSVIFLQLTFNSARWTRLLTMDGATLPFAKAYRFYLEGMFFNQALPGAFGGDIMRVYRVRPFCSSLGQAVNSALLDRLSGLMGLAIVIAVGLPLLLQKTSDSNVISGFVAIFALGALGILVALSIARLPDEGTGGKARTALVQFARLFSRLIKHPGEAFPVLIYALGTHLLLVGIAYISAVALGLDFTLIECLIVVPTSVLVSTLPISLGGWGVREGAMVAGFALIGASGGDAGAITLGIVIGLEMLVIGLIGGGVWLLGGAVRPDEELSEGGN